MISKSLLGVGAAALLCTAAPSQAATVLDPAGDFLPSFAGPNDADLDVLSFSVDYDPVNMVFNLGAMLAGPINAARSGLYVIGVDTGSGAIAPFASIGQPNVVFNQAIVIRKDGTGNVGATAIDSSSIIIAGNILAARLPASLFPSTGFTPERYGFNLWPRTGLGDLSQISDFAPDNANLAAAGVPEPAIWSLLILGFGAIAGMMRRRRHSDLRRVSPVSR
jgi:hypothetical protein